MNDTNSEQETTGFVADLCHANFGGLSVLTPSPLLFQNGLLCCTDRVCGTGNFRSHCCGRDHCGSKMEGFCLYWSEYYHCTGKHFV